MYIGDRELRAWVVPTFIGAVSFGVGAAIGYFAAKRKYAVYEYDEEEQEAIDFAERLRARNVEVVSVESDEQLVFEVNVEEDEEIKIIEQKGKQKTLDEIAKNVRASVVHHPANLEHQETVLPDPNWDYTEEIKHRSPDRPYIIHRDEYQEDEYGKDPTQATIHYYRGDDVLCDEMYQVIYRPDKVVGVLEFGKGSGDPNVCFVRNEELDVEYEVLLEPGYYFVSVLGGTVPDDPTYPDVPHKFMD